MKFIVTGRNLLVMLMLISHLVGCGGIGTWRAYDGPPQEKQLVASLKSTTFSKINFVKVSGIDGRSVDGEPEWIELLPGRHKVSWYFNGHFYEGRASACGTNSFYAVAGHKYCLEFTTLGSIRIKVNIVDYK